MAFWDKEFRREFCMFAALIVGVAGFVVTGLNLSHNLGSWPYGHTVLATVHQDNPSEAVSTPNSVWSEGNLTQWLIFVSTGVSIIAVGTLYYLGRTRPVHNGQLLIHSATWAPKGGHGNVTGRVRSLVNNDRLDIAVVADVLGDKHRGEGKYLTVAYSVVKKLEIPEWPKRRVVLPERPTDTNVA